MKKLIDLIIEWFKEFFSKCRFRKSYIDPDELFYIIGHRGSPTAEPENTLPSFRKALEDGANGLEIDLVITKDEKVVIWHDWDPDDTTALLREAGLEPFLQFKPHPPSLGSEFRKAVRELTFEEFSNNFFYKNKETNEVVDIKIPTLEEFLEEFKNDERLKVVFFDVKHPGTEVDEALNILGEIDKLIELHKPKFEAVVETAQPTIMQKWNEEFPDYNYCIDVEPPPGFVLNPRHYSAIKKAIKYNNNYALAMRPRKITVANWTTFRRIVKYDARKRFIFNMKNPDKKIKRLIGCTINKEHEMDCIVRIGIGGVQTDFPYRLKKIAIKHNRKLS